MYGSFMFKIVNQSSQTRGWTSLSALQRSNYLDTQRLKSLILQLLRVEVLRLPSATRVDFHHLDCTEHSLRNLCAHNSYEIAGKSAEHIVFGESTGHWLIHRTLIRSDYYQFQRHEDELQSSIWTKLQFMGLAPPLGVATIWMQHCRARVAQGIRARLT